MRVSAAELPSDQAEEPACQVVEGAGIPEGLRRARGVVRARGSARAGTGDGRPDAGRSGAAHAHDAKQHRAHGGRQDDALHAHAGKIRPCGRRAAQDRFRACQVAVSIVNWCPQPSFDAQNDMAQRESADPPKPEGQASIAATVTIARWRSTFLKAVGDQRPRRARPQRYPAGVDRPAAARLQLPPDAEAVAALAGTSDRALDRSTIMTTTTPTRPSGRDSPHKDSWLESIGKAIVAPVQGAQGGITAAHPEPDRAPPTPPPARPDVRHELPDQRDPRTVGDNNDGILMALGKAIVAPIDGAHEAAVRPDAGRARSGRAGARSSSAAGTASASVADSAPAGRRSA